MTVFRIDGQWHMWEGKYAMYQGLKQGQLCQVIGRNVGFALPSCMKRTIGFNSETPWAFLGFGDILASTFLARQYLLVINCQSLFAREFICQWHFLPGFFLPDHNLLVIVLPGHYLPVFFLPGHYLLATFFAWIHLPVAFIARIVWSSKCSLSNLWRISLSFPH